jgi:hypothetical protein
MRYRLRTLFILTTVVACLVAGGIAWEKHRQQVLLEQQIRELDVLIAEQREQLRGIRPGEGMQTALNDSTSP